MLSFAQWANRNWRSFRPAEVPKEQDALRLGLIGASNIAPFAVIVPAKTHPDIIVAAVAARDENRARAYAQTHGIPNVHGSYQALLDDPTLDAVYIALPNSLHYEWTIKALKAKKHILLEKPSTSNAWEAERLFRSPLLQQSGPRGASSLVLLDAVHVRFHPAMRKFLSLLEPSEIEEATATHHLPKGFIPYDDIRCKYELAGGCLMDLGSYSVQMIRQVFGAEPAECLSASARKMPPGYDQDIDHAFSATWRFPNGGIGHTVADEDTTGGHYLPWLTDRLPTLKSPMCSVRHRERVVPTSQGTEEVVTRTVVIWNALLAFLWHRIDIIEEHVVRNAKDGRVEKRWTEKTHMKQYQGGVGDDSWTTYRHQLEQFINVIRGREGSGIWIDGEDSIRQMMMIDQAYEKAGLRPRPSSSYEA